MPPKDNLYQVFDSSLPLLKERDILFITSKVVSIHQGRCFKKESVKKEMLVKKEADRYLMDTEKSGRILTTIHNAFSLNAGIDPFNGYYVLLPKNPMKAAKEIQSYISKKFSLSELGIVITDSHSAPLRRGVMCYAVGYFGISPYVEHGMKNKFAKWTTNALDSITATAGLYLGESAQQHQLTPIVILRNPEHILFSKTTYEKSFFVEVEDDMYGVLFKKFKNKK